MSDVVYTFKSLAIIMVMFIVIVMVKVIVMAIITVMTRILPRRE